MKFFRHLRRLRYCNSGLAALEFALVLPLMIIMLVGTTEIARYAIMQQKLRTATFAMADYTTRASAVSRSALNSYADAMQQIMKPFDFKGTVIFSSIASCSNGAGTLPPLALLRVQPDPCRGQKVIILWQHRALGGAGSRIGVAGGKPTFPQSYTMAGTQDVIAAEVFMEYAPMLPISGQIISALQPHTDYSWMILKPRQNKLTTLN